MPEFDWKTYSTTIQLERPTTEVRCYKQYRRGGKVFWRNYHRDVPGGSTFLERFGLLMDTTRRNVEADLARMIYA